VEQGQGCTEAIVTAEQAGGTALGSRYLFDADGRLVEALGVRPEPECVRKNLVSLQKRPRAYLAPGVAYLPELPRIRLLIVGGGHVGQAVAKLGAEVDFDVWVLDDRAAYASQERFPMAQERIVGDIGGKLQELAADITPAVFALIITR